jgi:hypothetical protein
MYLLLFYLCFITAHFNIQKLLPRDATLYVSFHSMYFPSNQNLLVNFQSFVFLLSFTVQNVISIFVFFIFYYLMLKGQYHEIFDPWFFSSVNPT